MPLRHPPATAGIHPFIPLRRFSHRTAYTSVLAANRSANNANLSATGDAIVTNPGAVVDSCSGEGAVSCPRNPSSLDSRAFSVCSRSRSRRSPVTSEFVTFPAATRQSFHSVLTYAELALAAAFTGRMLRL